MPEKLLLIEQILTFLAGGPLRIAELTRGLITAQLQAAPGSGESSANDVLAHLRACTDVWWNSMVTIINHDRPTIRAINPRTWIRSTDYLEQEFQPSLEAFTTQRTMLLAILEPLKPKIWYGKMRKWAPAFVKRPVRQAGREPESLILEFLR